MKLLFRATAILGIPMSYLIITLPLLGWMAFIPLVVIFGVATLLRFNLIKYVLTGAGQ